MLLAQTVQPIGSRPGTTVIYSSPAPIPLIPVHSVPAPRGGFSSPPPAPKVQEVPEASTLLALLILALVIGLDNFLKKKKLAR